MWVVQKRIIAFVIFEHPHIGLAISNSIISICHEYNIVDKIISICFDNASNNKDNES